MAIADVQIRYSVPFPPIPDIYQVLRYRLSQLDELIDELHALGFGAWRESDNRGAVLLITDAPREIVGSDGYHLLLH